RPLLALLAAGGGAALVGAVSDKGLIGDLLGALLTADATAAPPTSLLAVRADDGLLVSFSFVNLDVRTGGGNPPRLALTNTANDAPYRLFLSPPDTALFSAQKNPVTRNGRTELWHARAVPQLPGGGAAQTPGDVPLRAIWSPDIDAPLTQPPWAADPNLGQVS